MQRNVKKVVDLIKSDSSRQEFSDEYLVAAFGFFRFRKGPNVFSSLLACFDTAENESLKVFRKINGCVNFFDSFDFDESADTGNEDEVRTCGGVKYSLFRL